MLCLAFSWGKCKFEVRTVESSENAYCNLIDILSLHHRELEFHAVISQQNISDLSGLVSHGEKHSKF